MSDEVLSETLTEAERLLLGTSEILEDGGDREFCGIELGTVSLKSQRYVERIITKYSAVGPTVKEMSLMYAFLLTLDIPTLRTISRSLDAIDAHFDDFIEKLPSPIPAEEIAKLEVIAKRDEDAVRALQVEVEPKPGENAEDPTAPKNS